MASPRRIIGVETARLLSGLKGIVAMLALIAACSLTGCTSPPPETAKFFIESELKGNDSNARNLVVSDQRGDYSNNNMVIRALFPKMKEDEPRPPDVDTVARILAAALVLKEVEKSSDKIVYEYTFDIDLVRKGLQKKGIASQSLLDETIREANLTELKKFSHRLVLVKEDKLWKVDYRASK